MFKKTKFKNRKGKIYRIISLLQIIASLIFMGVMIYINVLPVKYLLLIFGFIFIVNIIFVFIMLKNKKKKKLKIITSIISVIMSLVLSILSFFIFQTAGVLNNMNDNYTTYNYSVVVLNDSDYEKIKDLKNKTMGYFKVEDNESIDKALAKINSLVKVDTNSYNDLSEISNDLLEGTTESILLEDSYYKLLTDTEEGNVANTNFKEKTKVIYTFSIKVKSEDVSNQVNVTKEAFNVYISGIDTYGTISSVSRSDVNIVATVNPKTRQILLTSIPRDYYVQLSGTTGYKDKLTHAGMYGVEKSISTIEDLLDIEINYYFKVNFTSVIDIINALDGVDVYSDYTFTSQDGYYYTKGYNYVNGEEALSFVRERYAFSEGDRQRGKNQQALIDAVLKKCTSPSIITKYNSLLKSIDGSFVTNMSSNEITSLIKMQLKDNKSWTVTSNSLTGTDSSNYTYSYSTQKLYVMEPDEESINDAKTLINSVLNDETLDGSYNETGSSHSVTKQQSQSTNTSDNKKNEVSNKTETKKEETIKKEENKDKQEDLEVEEKKLILKLDTSNTSSLVGNYSEGDIIVEYGDEDVTDMADYKFSIKDSTGTVVDTANNVDDLVTKINYREAGNYTIEYIVTYDGKSASYNKNLTLNEEKNDDLID